MPERPRGPQLPRAASACLIALGVGVLFGEHAAAQGEDAVASLQRSIVEVIASSERSVVAISRSVIAPGRNAPPLQPGVLQRLNQIERLPGQGAIVDPLAALSRAAPVVRPHAFGAGVVIGDGVVLTQYLVVKSGEAHTVTTIDGVAFDADLVAADPRSGLATLKLKRAASSDEPAPPPLPIGHAEELRKGMFVVAIGNPFAIQSDGQPTASWGTISNTARKAPPGENLNDVGVAGDYRTTLHHFGSLIQTDARLGWNASGGALVTLDGKLVGVTTTASTIAGHERPAGYAIPLNELMRRVVKTLSEGREPEYGLLGLTFDRNPAVSSTTGAAAISVSGTFRGSPAARAGLQKGDLVTAIEGRPTIDADSLQLAVSSLPPGSLARVDYERGGEEQRTSLRLGKAFVQGERVVTNRKPPWRGIRVDYSTAVPPVELQRAAQEGRIDPEGCVVVAEVDPDSASWRSGVRPYAYISHVGGKRVATPEDFYAVVSEFPDTVNVRFTKPLVSSPPVQPPPQRIGGPVGPFVPNAGQRRLEQQRRELLQDLQKLVEPLPKREEE